MCGKLFPFVAKKRKEGKIKVEKLGPLGGLLRNSLWGLLEPIRRENYPGLAKGKGRS